MYSLLVEYGLFVAKILTVTFCIILILSNLAKRKKDKPCEEVSIDKINEKYDSMREIIEEEILSKQELKQKHKEKKQKDKQAKKNDNDKKSKVYLIKFDGDIEASGIKELREEITAILMVATADDEVVLNLESPGGLVHSYGLAAAQLDRLKRKNIKLTVCVDLVAASGGYMMAAVADKILAAPFAVVGSVGVVAEMLNFNKLLNKYDINVEHHTAGKYKTTLNQLAANTDEGRAKFIEELNSTHNLFKHFIIKYRQNVDIEKIATGEHWYGMEALELNLIDDITTSDDYLLEKSESCDIYEVEYSFPQSLKDKITAAITLGMKKIMLNLSNFNKLNLSK